MARAQWVLGGVSPSVAQSSRMVWSNVPGRSAALNRATVASSAAGSSARSVASSPMEPAFTGGETARLELPLEFWSIVEEADRAGRCPAQLPHPAERLRPKYP